MTLDPVPDPTPDLEAARAAFKAFVEPIPHDVSVVALHDSDADGLAAGVLWQRGLERLGFSNLRRLLPDRQRSAWSESNRETIRQAAPDRLFVLDLGSQPEPVLPGVSTCFVDHHRPGGAPPGDTLVSAYTWDPIPTTALLTWELFAGLTGGASASQGGMSMADGAMAGMDRGGAGNASMAMPMDLNDIEYDAYLANDRTLDDPEARPPILVDEGDRVEVTMRNASMMAHPMHLHGHHFQVVAIDGERFAGAVRDTVLVPPMRSVTIAVDAGNPGQWAFHCHHLYHMAAGMMATFAYRS